METIEDLIKRAEQYGINRCEIGKHIWGDKNKRRIYLYKNPTIKSLELVKKGVDELIAEKTIKKVLKNP